MSNQFLSFRKFPSYEQLKEAESLLQLNGIQTTIAEDVSPFGNAVLPTNNMFQYELKIKKDDLEKAGKLLLQQADEELENIDRSYYLFSFTDEELYDVVLNQDQWNEFDFKLSQKILNERGKVIDEDYIKSIREKKLEKMAMPEKSQSLWIVIGYIAIIFMGFLSIVLGYIIWTSKKTLPDGTTHYSYSDGDRKHGEIIFYLGLFVFLVVTIIRIFNSYELYEG